MYDLFFFQYHFGRSINSQYSCPNVFVSREHCKISFNNACQPRIYDKNTLNGTFINGQRISSNENQILKKGDVIGLGVDSSLSNYIEGAFVYKLDIDESIQVSKNKPYYNLLFRNRNIWYYVQQQKRHDTPRVGSCQYPPNSLFDIF